MSDSAFLELEKGTASPSAGATDFDRFYVDPADNKFTRKKSDGSTEKYLEEGTYTASDIANVPAGSIAATDVQAALNELDTEKLDASHAGTGGASHADATTSVSGFMSAVDKIAINYLKNNLFNAITVTSPIAGTTARFTTLTAAFASIPAATNSTDARQVYFVYVPSGTYDEDLTIATNNRRIVMVCQGSVALGVLSGSSWGTGGTPRNMTLSNDGTATIGGIRSAFAITSISPTSDGFSTHQANISKLKISGNLVLTAAIGISSEFFLECEVFGNMDTSGYTGNCNVYTRNSRYRGTFGGTPTRLQYANRCQFDGLLTVNNYSLINECNIAAGMTVSSASPDLSPSGIRASNFTGTFTGVAGSLVVDKITNLNFINNSCVLAGGATKLFLELDYIPHTVSQNIIIPSGNTLIRGKTALAGSNYIRINGDGCLKII